MSETWVMAGSSQDDDTVHVHADEELKLVDSSPGFEHHNSPRRRQSRSQSPRSGSSTISAPSHLDDKDDLAAPESDTEPLLDCLPTRHRIASDAEGRSRSPSPGPSEPRGARPAPPPERAAAAAAAAALLGRPPSSGRASPPSPGSPLLWAEEPEERKEAPAPRNSFPTYLSLFLAVLSLCVAASSVSYGVPAKEDISPAAVMVMHSAKRLNLSEGTSKASIAVLQDKLQLKQMQVDLDTQVFTAEREAAKELIASMCNLPEKICNSMVAAIGTSDIKFHKKSSVPLDSNQGSYYGVWMWVKETGDRGEVQVAFKAASLSYQLRDVVTYRNQIDDEPVIKCETVTNNLWFIRGTQENCREVSRRRTITPLPVFKQSIMNPEEMHLVDTLMESMLAKKVLETTNVEVPPLPGSDAIVHRAFEGGH